MKRASQVALPGVGARDGEGDPDVGERDQAQEGNVAHHPHHLVALALDLERLPDGAASPEEAIAGSRR